MSVDGSLYRAVNRLADRTPWAHGVVTAYAKGGVVVFGLLLVLGWWQARRRPEATMLAAVAWAGAGTLVALGIGQVIGGLVARARPYDSMSGVHLLVARTQDFSFPSDHATMAGAVAAGLWLAERRLGIVAVVMAVAMAGARVYVGAHYPADVVAGLVLGAGVLIGGWFAVRRPIEALIGTLSRTWLRPVLTAGSLRT